jgi:hypothetical protein
VGLRAPLRQLTRTRTPARPLPEALQLQPTTRLPRQETAWLTTDKRDQELHIVESIKDRLDELPPGPEYDRLLAALDALEGREVEDADEIEIDSQLIEEGRKLAAQHRAIAVEREVLLREIEALSAQDRGRPEVQEVLEQLREDR